MKKNLFGGGFTVSKNELRGAGAAVLATIAATYLVGNRNGKAEALAANTAGEARAKSVSFLDRAERIDRKSAFDAKMSTVTPQERAAQLEIANQGVDVVEQLKAAVTKKVAQHTQA